ncbi:MAG: hypothetical protein JXN10_05590 [Clostridia bacterium]|nr:hypothetical protein [Clostridia bacterium]MBN2882981.1 hypothetical protein [Clostridia bacterium]
MDVILIILLSIGAIAAITAMILSRRRGKCASCPYYDSCPRLNCEKDAEKGENKIEGSS